MKYKGILVTGTHRSGTTWVGNMLSLPGNVAYIHEPFNIELCKRTIPYQLEYWFTNTHDLPDPETFYAAFRKGIEFRYVEPVPEDHARHFAYRILLKRFFANLPNRVCMRIPLIKDPIALMSAEDLASRYNLGVVCMIRNPLAFCSSIKKWDWDFPFDHLLNQPRLMDRFFREDEEQIRQYHEEKQPVLKQAVLLWNLFHKVIRHYEEKHDDWIFARHEDLVADPVNRFREIYARLGLRFTRPVAEKIETSLTSREGETGSAAYKARDAKKVTSTWKSRLEDDEVAFIQEETKALREHYYPSRENA